MSTTFQNTRSLENIPLFDCSLVTTTSNMFSGACELREFPKLVMPKLVTANGMFLNCNSLALIDLSGIDLTKLTSYGSFFGSTGLGCRQAGGAYADGIPYVYVMNEENQDWVLNAVNSRPTTWSTANVIIAGSEQDLRG